MAEKWTLKSPVSGEVFAEFLVETEALPAAGETPNQQGRDNGKHQVAETMTEPQRRFLFRLLAAQKVTGKDAEQHLKAYFKVATLGAIPKEAASKYIDQMVKDKKDAEA
jgi:hypothetical protein